MERLSALIELGAVLVPEDHSYHGCAIGAAFAAVAPAITKHVPCAKKYEKLRTHLAAYTNLQLDCPLCHANTTSMKVIKHLHPQGMPLLWVVDHLHTDHDWPRLQIARWLKPIEDAWERAHAPTTTQPEVNNERIEEQLCT